MNDDEPDLEPDAHVSRLLSESGDTEDVVPLVGFVGGEMRPGHVRFYANPSLSRWIDVPRAEIVYRHRVTAEHDELGGRSIIFVRRAAMDAEFTAAPPERLQAEFLEGPFSAEPLLPQTLLEAANLLTFFGDLGPAYCSFVGTKTIKKCLYYVD